MLISKRSVILLCSADPVIQHEHLEELVCVILAYAFMLFGECNSILARHLADKMYELQSILPVLMMMQNYHKYFSLWNFYTEISQNTSKFNFLQ